MCPWHGWEYDIETGDCLSKRSAFLPSYPVEVRDGEIVVTL
jgi:nitrite reductase/ring-hydroxylating ferredoxin subunit